MLSAEQEGRLQQLRRSVDKDAKEQGRQGAQPVHAARLPTGSRGLE